MTKRAATIVSILLLTAGAASAQVAADQWNPPDGLPFLLYQGARMVQTDADTLYLVTGGGPSPTTFMKYKVSTKTATTLTSVPVNVGFGSSMAWLPGTNFIYLQPGNNSITFYRCDITANAGLGGWSAMANYPGGFGAHYGSSLCAAGGKLYWSGGSNSPNSGTGFFEFTTPEVSPPLGAWATKASTPSNMFRGGQIGYPGGDFIYAVNGTALWRYALNFPNAATQALNTWSTLAVVPENVDFGSAIMGTSASTLFMMTGNFSDDHVGFFRFDVNAGAAGGGTWVKLADRPGAVGPAGSLAWFTGGDTIFATRGGDVYMTNTGTVDLWRYSISGNRWGPLATTTGTTNIGSCAAGVNDGETIYHVIGGNDTGFEKYSISANTWTRLADTPPGNSGVGGFWDGAAMAWGGGDHLYAVGLSGLTTAFLRYTISADFWESTFDSSWAPPLPAGFTSGAQLLRTGPDTLLYYPGGNASTYRFTISTKAWSSPLAAPPASISSNGVAAWDGNDLVYFLRGQSLTTMYVYCISRNQWNVKTDGTAFTPPACPDIINPGSAMYFPAPGRHLFVFCGYSYSTFASRLWTYQLPDAGTPTGTWTQRANAPGTVWGGTCFAYPGRDKLLYALQGNVSRALWSYWLISDPPADPTTLSQVRLDGTTPFQGIVTAETGFTARATVTDPYGDRVRLVVEWKPAAGAFDGTTNIVYGSYVTSGLQATVTVPAGTLTPGNFKWRVRTQDDKEFFSTNWVAFGGGGTDFTVRVNAAPLLSQLQQLDATGAPVAVGGGFFTGGEVQLRAAVSDPDAPDKVKIDIEVQPLGTPFTNQATATATLVANGGLPTVLLKVGEGSYHWQARPADEWNQAASWAPFGNNPESQADFVVYRTGSANEAKACAAGAAGLPVAALAIAGIAAILRRR